MLAYHCNLLYIFRFCHDNIVTCSRDGSAIIWIPRSRRSHVSSLNKITIESCYILFLEDILLHFVIQKYFGHLCGMCSFIFFPCQICKSFSSLFLFQGKVGRWTRAYHLKVPPPPLPPQPPRGGPRQRFLPTPRGVNMIVWSLDNRFVLAAIMGNVLAKRRSCTQIYMVYLHSKMMAPCTQISQGGT